MLSRNVNSYSKNLPAALHLLAKGQQERRETERRRKEDHQFVLTILSAAGILPRLKSTVVNQLLATVPERQRG